MFTLSMQSHCGLVVMLQALSLKVRGLSPACSIIFSGDLRAPPDRFSLLLPLLGRPTEMPGVTLCKHLEFTLLTPEIYSQFLLGC